MRLRATLLAFLVTSLSLSGPAFAYSAEAVADGEKLLAATLESVKGGEATAQDLTIVRYHLLEMKMKAGRISINAFCPLARAELVVMAKAGGDEETRTGIEELSDKIATMNASLEMCRVASDAVDGYLFGDRSTNPTDQELADARREAETARRRLQAGEIGRTDAARAEAIALEVEFGAGKLDRDAYCRSRQGEVLEDLARWVEAEAQVGQAALLQRLDARRRLFRFRALCQKPG
jgi:hypothetical protein